MVHKVTRMSPTASFAWGPACRAAVWRARLACLWSGSVRTVPAWMGKTDDTEVVPPGFLSVGREKTADTALACLWHGLPAFGGVVPPADAIPRSWDWAAPSRPIDS